MADTEEELVRLLGQHMAMDRRMGELLGEMAENIEKSARQLRELSETLAGSPEVEA